MTPVHQISLEQTIGSSTWCNWLHHVDDPISIQIHQYMKLDALCVDLKWQTKHLATVSPPVCARVPRLAKQHPVP